MSELLPSCQPESESWCFVAVEHLNDVRPDDLNGGGCSGGQEFFAVCPSPCLIISGLPRMLLLQVLALHPVASLSQALGELGDSAA